MSSYVQSAIRKDTLAESSTTLAYGSNNATGDILVACARWEGGAADLSNVTDSAGNAWTRAAATASDSSGSKLSIWYVIGCKPGANTVTFTWSSSASQPIVVAVGEWVGPGNAVVDTAVIQDVSEGACCPPPTLSFTTTAANDLCVFFGSDEAADSATFGNATTRSVTTLGCLADNFALGSGLQSEQFNSSLQEALLGVVAFKSNVTTITGTAAQRLGGLNQSATALLFVPSGGGGGGAPATSPGFKDRGLKPYYPAEAAQRLGGLCSDARAFSLPADTPTFWLPRPAPAPLPPIRVSARVAEIVPPAEAVAQSTLRSFSADARLNFYPPSTRPTQRLAHEPTQPTAAPRAPGREASHDRARRRRRAADRV